MILFAFGGFLIACTSQFRDMNTDLSGITEEDLKEDKKGGKEDESNSIQNQKMILLQYAKEHCFPNPTFFVDDGYSGTNYDRPGFQAMLAEIEAGRVAV